MPKRTTILAAMALLAAGTTYAASRTTSATVSVTIRPAVSLVAQGTGVAVKIRLAPQAQAKLWRANECVLAPASTYVISQSGTYDIESNQIEGEGNRICLASSDGSLNSTIALPAPER